MFENNTININSDSSIDMKRLVNDKVQNSFILTNDGEFKINSADDKVSIESHNGDLIINVTGSVKINRVGK